jgi:hypothetical protein
MLLEGLLALVEQSSKTPPPASAQAAG